MKYFLAQIICAVMDAIFRKKLSGVPIIFYHSIGEEDSKLCVSGKMFEKQMKFLSDNGWRSILPKDLENAFEDDKVFLITFDDGFKTVREKALPVLKKYGFVGTVFVATDYIGKKSSYARNVNDKNFDILSADDIKILGENKWYIANHFASHRNLIELSKNEVQKEYQNSCESLSAINIHTQKNIVAYPFNRYNDTLIAVLKEQGVHMAFNAGNRIHQKLDNLLVIPRIEANNNFSKFKLNFSPTFYKYAR